MKKHYKKHSTETRRKMSESTKKFWESSRGLLKKHRLSLMMAKRLKGKTYFQLYGDREENIKKKIGLAQKGKPKSEEHNLKNCISHLGKKRPPFSEEWKRKIGESQTGKKGSNWRGGKSFEKYGLLWTKKLREVIRKRDYFRCKICGIKQEDLFGYSKKLDIHHIDYNKNNLNPVNLVSLCRKCHAKTNHNRKKWIKFFINLKKLDGNNTKP